MYMVNAWQSPGEHDTHTYIWRKRKRKKIIIFLLARAEQSLTALATIHRDGAAEQNFSYNANYPREPYCLEVDQYQLLSQE